MLLARVVGLVVATPKADELEGLRFALLQPVDANLGDRGHPVVAVDSVGAGAGQIVFTASAGSAREARGLSGRPVDLAIVGIVDDIARDRGRTGATRVGGAGKEAR